MLGDEADVREHDLGTSVLLGDVERDGRAGPLLAVRDERELAVEREPGDAAARDELRDAEFRVVHAVDEVGELLAEPVGAALDVRLRGGAGGPDHQARTSLIAVNASSGGSGRR